MKPQRTPRRRKHPRRGGKAKPAKPAQPVSTPAAPPPKVGAGGAAPPKRKATLPAGGAPRRPAGTRPKPEPVTGGISFVTVLLFIVAIVIAGFMLKVMFPKNLSHIDGFPKPRWEGEERNLLQESQQILIEREKPLRIPESEINAYLRGRIKGKQGGPFAAIVKYVGTFVDIEDGYVEIYVVRTVMGANFSISTRFIQKDLGGGDLTWVTDSGSVGGLGTGAKQFEPVAKAIKRIAATCEDELDVINAMGKIGLEKDAVVLDPRY